MMMDGSRSDRETNGFGSPEHFEWIGSIPNNKIKHEKRPTTEYMALQFYRTV